MRLIISIIGLFLSFIMASLIQLFALTYLAIDKVKKVFKNDERIRNKRYDNR
jgi:hypothetical protein